VIEDITIPPVDHRSTPRIHFGGGLPAHPPKFPGATAAALALDILDNAKGSLKSQGSSVILFLKFMRRHSKIVETASVSTFLMSANRNFDELRCHAIVA
jgi:hypothetical protein